MIGFVKNFCSMKILWAGRREPPREGVEARFPAGAMPISIFCLFFGLLIVFADSAYKETIGGVKYITAKFKEV